MNETFRKIAGYISRLAGLPWTFLAAVFIVLAWLISGPFFGFSNTWQLVINTGTTIITFLMVFLIQNTQNRETKAINLKLDELIHAVKEASDNMVSLENASDEELESVQVKFQDLREKVTNGDKKKKAMGGPNK